MKWLDWVKKVSKKTKEKPENILEKAVYLAWQQHVASYPHSYFIRKAPREWIFERRYYGNL